MTRKKKLHLKERGFCASKEILIKELEQIFRNLETAKQQIVGLDPSVGKNMTLRRNLEN
jgi:hypothetical protein